MSRSGIYLLTHIASGRQYVGQSRDIPKRLASHARGRGNTPIAQAIADYGWEAFASEILECCPPDALNEAEARWMRHYRCRVPAGFNTKAGGDHTPAAFRSPRGQGIPNTQRVAANRAKHKAAGGKQINFMMTAAEVEVMKAWTDAGYSMTQAVNKVLEESNP